MARVSRQFADDFQLVTDTWVARRDHTAKEIAEMRAMVRVELAEGPGLPVPVINGEPVNGWRTLSQAQRTQYLCDVFGEIADKMRADLARSECIRAEVRTAREAA